MINVKSGQVFLDRQSNTRLTVTSIELVSRQYSGSIYAIWFKEENGKRWFRRINSNSFFNHFKRV